MAYWLFKSEPFKWSWEMQKARGEKGEQWDGVRNYQARNNMRAMKLGDKGFFYHSNEGLEVVGIARSARWRIPTAPPTIRAGNVWISRLFAICRSR
ncbi:hypothetical protein P041_01944 [Brucella sp. 04-5288]|nr:hypothetical protein P041_01944 [Brucella sp. 04-5288]